MTEIKQDVRPEPMSSAKKTMDLFSKARQAINSNDTVKLTTHTISEVSKEPLKMREIKPKQKRTGLWKKPEVDVVKIAEDTVRSLSKSPASPKPKVDIPFSKNRYEKDVNNEELEQENKKKAIKFLKKQKQESKKKAEEKKILMERKKEYTEKIRMQNKEKLSKRRRRNNSVEGINSSIKQMKHATSVRSKSEEIKGKSYRLARKYANKRKLQTHHSENKNQLSGLKHGYIKTLSVEEETQNHTIDQKYETFYDQHEHKPETRVSINLNLASKMKGKPDEYVKFAHIDNSEQKNSVEDDTKYVKTPELDMNGKYSHKHSDNKLSARSTEKESRRTNRCHSSQKKKSIQVAKEIRECKRDLIKMQKISEVRKRRIFEDTEQDREIERRKHNLETLNEMLKKRNQHFKKKKRNQENRLKKDLDQFEKSMGVSFSKKKKKRINVANMKRNKTFSCLSSKGQCDTLNTSKNEIATEKKQRKNLLEFKISIKKEKGDKNQDTSCSAIYSPTSKPMLSSHKKKSNVISNSKKYSGKKITDSIKTSSSSKMKSANKLVPKSANTSQILHPKRGYANAHKKKKAIQSESKRQSDGGANQFNDISEIQEFNMTDEESLINSSILKNIDDHESIHQDGCRESMTKSKPKKSMQSTLKKTKKTAKKVKKMKFISSAKKSVKKPKPNDTQKDTDRKSVKKRKVVFHISKKQSQNLDQDYSPEDPVPEHKIGQIKRVDYIDTSGIKEEDTEVVNLNDGPTSGDAFDESEYKQYDKIDMINSAKLSELLSSKKKHRYKQVKDSMDGVIDENIGQHINFTDEEEHLQLKEFNSNNNSGDTEEQESLEDKIDRMVDQREQHDGYTNEEDSIEEHNLSQKHSLGYIHSQIDSPIKSREGSNENTDSRQDIRPEREIVFESLTYQQVEDERNDYIEDTSNENQTVVNCTQSDEHLSQYTSEDRVSERNIVAEEFSLEYDNQYTHSSEGIAQVSISKDDRDAIREQQMYSYEEEQESEESAEGEEFDDEYLSRIEYPMGQSSHQQSYDQSEEKYGDQMIQEVEEDSLYDENADEKKLFDKTLTNMRLAFGSELKIRENSVKTLEKADNSGSGSGDKTEEKSSIFEKKSFQDFSMKKFTELMHVKNMKNFQTTIQKTFREYSKDQILTASDKKDCNNRTSFTPKKNRPVSPRKFSMKDIELDRIGSEKMKQNSAKKSNFVNQIIGSSSSKNLNKTGILYRTNLSMDKYRKEMSVQEFSEDNTNSVHNIEYKVLSPKKNRISREKEKSGTFDLLEPINLPTFESPEKSKSSSNPSS